MRRNAWNGIQGFFDFNPRTPREVRHARCCTGRQRKHFNPRTPREVRLNVDSTTFCASTFQSTHPARGATKQHQHNGPGLWISIHAPRERCDTHSARFRVERSISIHAPRERCDHFAPCRARVRYDFNPRTPREVRLDGNSLSA